MSFVAGANFRAHALPGYQATYEHEVGAAARPGAPAGATIVGAIKKV